MKLFRNRGKPRNGDVARKHFKNFVFVHLFDLLTAKSNLRTISPLIGGDFALGGGEIPPLNQLGGYM